jgi:hypothetical protein
MFSGVNMAGQADRLNLPRGCDFSRRHRSQGPPVTVAPAISARAVAAAIVA